MDPKQLKTNTDKFALSKKQYIIISKEFNLNNVHEKQ